MDGVDAAKQYASRLAGDGFMALDLSGNFSSKAVEEISEAAGESIRVCKAQYTINGLTRLSHITSAKEYGVIVKVDGLEKPRGVMLKSDGAGEKGCRKACGDACVIYRALQLVRPAQDGSAGQDHRIRGADRNVWGSVSQPQGRKRLSGLHLQHGTADAAPHTASCRVILMIGHG